MSIKTFINYLTKLFKKEDVFELCTITKTTIEQQVITAYEPAKDLFNTNKFNNPELNKLSEEFFIYLDFKKYSNRLVSVIYEAFKNSLPIIAYIEAESNKLLSENETSATLNYKKANLIRSIQVINFGAEYSLRLLNYIYFNESKSLDKDAAGQLSKAEMQYITDNLKDFAICINLLVKTVDAFKSSIDSLPDSYITDISEATLVALHGATHTDPFRYNELSTRINLFYHIGRFIAARQAEKYKSSKDQLLLLQNRMMQLEKARAKQQDAKLDKQIEVYQDRIDKLVYKIEQMKDNYEL